MYSKLKLNWLRDQLNNINKLIPTCVTCTGYFKLRDRLISKLIDLPTAVWPIRDPNTILLAI